MTGYITWLCQRLLIAVLRLYQAVLSPILPGTCRFVPSCSEYAIQVLDRHGCLQGAWLVLQRLGRCHPWQPGGYDPAP